MNPNRLSSTSGVVLMFDVIGVAAAILCALLLAFNMVNSLPFNTVASSRGLGDRAGPIPPQGWAFFTKDPLSAEVDLLRRRDLASVRHGVGFSAQNWFGFDRGYRAFGPEIAGIANAVPKDSWKPCDQDLAECIARQPNVLQLDNPSPDPMFCGDFVVTATSPAPWSWARRGLRTTMPPQVVAVEISCRD